MMEEAPKIERVVASQGISISDTAKILTSYLSKVNHHHQSINFNDTSKDDANLDNDNGDDHANNNKSPIRKSKQEREEDALIAQMDQLANSNKSSGMISDDIYERLKQITQSITAEVEGRTISACGLDKNKDSDDNVNDTTAADDVNDTPDDGVNDFQAGQSENHTKQQQEVQVQVQQQTDTTPKSHIEKKKAKKDKKSAKKAKKEAKRKAKEMEEDETITTDIPLHRKKKIY